MKISGTRMMSLPILLALSVPVGATSYAGITIETEQATLIESNVASMTPAETIVLRGRVIDTNGDALPGVTVQMTGTSTGVVTDANGKFSISLPKGQPSTVVFSYIGMKNETYACNGKKDANIVIRMQEDASQINEVVVTGIVTKRKETFTGSSSSFSGEELKSVSVQNPIAALKALDPAFNVMDDNLFGSDPNRMPNIEIRGKSSVLGMRDELSEDPNQPLFILDGFESSLEAIYNLDINRIASMTLLKDAASTAIYGSKAANGVVVVETIKPKAGKLRISYNGSLDISIPDLNGYNLMDAKEKLAFEKMAGKYINTNYPANMMVELDNLYQQRMADVASGVDTYWLSEPLRTGINHRHQLYLEGGADGFLFGIGLNYNNVDGVMKKSNREVYGANLDLTYRVGKLQFSNKATAQKTNTKNPTVSFSDYAAANPYFKKYDENGEINKYLANNMYEGTIGNPMYNDNLNSRDEGDQLMLSDYFIAEYTPLKDLKLRGKFGITYYDRNTEQFTSPDDTRFENYNILKRGLYNHGNTKTTNYEGDFTAIYATVLNDVHRFNVALGGNIAESRSTINGYSAQGFPSGDFTYPSFSNGYPEGGRPTYSESVSRSASAYLSAGYSFLDRYLLDASYRMSGSSIFGANKRTISTWSLGLGWNIHNENFIKDNLPFINYMKIRGSVGNPGNQNYDSALSLTTFSYSYLAYNYFGLSSVLGNLGNDNLEWQTTKDYNVGIDLTLFNNRLNITADYYHKSTDPLLIAIGLPASSGLAEKYNSSLGAYTTSYNTNLGKQISKGFTATVQYYLLRNLKERLTWSVRGTVRMESNELNGIGNTLETLNKYGQSRSTQRFFDGADPDDIWAVRSAGIDPATGREIFIKKDGTYTYDFSYADEVIVGNARPDAEGTFGTNFGYHGITFGAIFRYRIGADSFNTSVFNKVENLSMSSLNYNQDKRALYDRWQKPGDYAQFKNIAASENTPMSSRFVQTENILSLESLQVGYEFEPQLARNLGVSGLRLSAYMNDIFRISNIKQERGTSYPFARSFSFALSVTL
ncbi:MAG: SusC/RagA family TonB-linked outer membrane protein [Prevotella sp.]|nr:SusC/RagA family TonB-linked outer membrane protein [Prevotella sp.]